MIKLNISQLTVPVHKKQLVPIYLVQYGVQYFFLLLVDVFFFVLTFSSLPSLSSFFCIAIDRLV